MKAIEEKKKFLVLGIASALAVLLAGHVATAVAGTSGTFSTTGSMNISRAAHTATLLNNGKVLITGGVTKEINGGTSNLPWQDSIPLSSAELYNPATGTFTPTGDMTISRAFHTATVLNTGKVLITGAYLDVRAELYDPATGTFTPTGIMTISRTFHTATLLPNGQVLIAGGLTGGIYPQASVLSSAELYDPATGTFTSTGNMTGAHLFHTATLLANGLVLITGEPYYGGEYTAELYNPATGTFTHTGQMVNMLGRWGHTATLLNNGRVLIAGGGGSPQGAELYDPDTGTFAPTGDMTSPRTWHAATLLNNGQILMAGGYAYYCGWAASELYDPSTGTFASTGDMTVGRFYHTTTLLQNGQVLVAGGESVDPPPLSNAELYTPPYVLVQIDIKSTSGLKCFNQNERGVIPVAIFGSDALNVANIDIGSLWLQGLSVKVTGKSNKYLAHFEDINKDGYDDLIIQFQDSDGWVVPGSDYATLKGKLYNGTQIMGQDTICIIP